MELAISGVPDLVPTHELRPKFEYALKNLDRRDTLVINNDLEDIFPAAAPAPTRAGKLSTGRGCLPPPYSGN